MFSALRPLVILGVLATPVAGADPALAQGACLSRHDQRSAVQSGRAVRPKEVRRTLGGKMLRLRLCDTAGGLVYKATTLRSNGRVRRHVLDAESGQPIR
ncbi:MAG: hypothetical protein AAGB11_03660 [Pseudomonadota bacterium]